MPINKPAFSIYDASAGSGKTFTLVKEYLKILFTSSGEDTYKAILGITFTNKAVGEMKERIVNALSDFSQDNPSYRSQQMMQVLSQECSLSREQIRAKSTRIIKSLVHNYAAFDILTIDRFTHRVIRAFAHDLNLPATFEVTLDTDSLLREAVDAIVARAGEDNILTKLLVDFTMEKTDDDRSWDVTGDFLNIGRLLLKESNRNEVGFFKEISVAAFLQHKELLKAQMQLFTDAVVGWGREAYALITSHGLSEKSFSRGTVYHFFRKTAEGDFSTGTSVFNALQEGKRYAKSVPVHEQQIVDAIAPQLELYAEKIQRKVQEQLFYEAFLKNLTPLSLLNTISVELDRIQQEQNVLSIAEFNSIIHREIQHQPAPFIYERMGERYRHFFIDEFQDTSELQWQNLIPLIDNALASEDLSGERGSLMIVGDPKQSIYRWRGGKAEQFIELVKGKNPFINPDKKVFHLDTNYRSYSEIIAFNNRFFKIIASEFSNPDYRDLYENHSFQNITDKKGGGVSLRFIPKSSDEESTSQQSLFLEETRRIINEVLDSGFQYKDIAVLTRKKGSGAAVARYLTEEKIPVISSESLLLSNSSEVRLIIQVLRYLKNPDDKESKAMFLQYISQVTDHSLEAHDFIVQGMKLSSERALEAWLQSFNISLSFNEIRKRSLYEATEQIITQFIRADQTNAYIQCFLDIVLERDLKSRLGIGDFLEFWDQNPERFSIPSPEGSNAIRILTIHKSKGLEFPVVIFPFAEEEYGRGPKDKVWINTEGKIEGLPKVLVNYSGALQQFGEQAATVYELKKEEELLDNINILYVALTRAEEQLHIVSVMNLKQDGLPVSNTQSSFFIKFLMSQNLFHPDQYTYTFGSFQKVSPEGGSVSVMKIIENQKKRIGPESVKIAKREALMWGSDQEEAVEYGNIIHEILSHIIYKSDLATAVNRALEEALVSSQQKEKIEKGLRNIIEHPEVAVFFDNANTIWTEQTIIRKSGSLLKPDRVVETPEGEVMILDYKTGMEDKKHHKQIREYAATLEEMGKKVVRKTLLYWNKAIIVVEAE